jgi:molecular chaperone GrpE (heat shock protein)
VIGKILNAAVLIVSETIEEWATKVTREDLLGSIDDLSLRINQLEEELDETTEAAAVLRLKLLDAEMKLADALQERDVARAKDPDPFNPYESAVAFKADTIDSIEYVRNSCPECLKSFTHCGCIPF